MTKNTTVLVVEAKQRIETLTVDQAVTALARREAILIDLREPGERAQQGAIPGAVHSPWGLLAFWDDMTTAYYLAKLDPNGRIVLHCASGGISVRAATTLQQLGYTNVAHLDGGFNAWKAAGHPVQEATV